MFHWLWLKTWWTWSLLVRIIALSRLASLTTVQRLLLDAGSRPVLGSSMYTTYWSLMEVGKHEISFNEWPIKHVFRMLPLDFLSGILQHLICVSFLHCISLLVYQPHPHWKGSHFSILHLRPSIFKPKGMLLMT